MATDGASRVVAQDASRELSTLQVQQYVSSDRPADHAKLSDHLTGLAERYAADAARHSAMAQAYRSNPNRRGGDPAVHCDRMVKVLREAAAEAQAAAKHHRQLAD